MKRVYHIQEEDSIIEKAFKEGYEHGYYKAVKELESSHKEESEESFNEKIARLKTKYE